MTLIGTDPLSLLPVDFAKTSRCTTLLATTHVHHHQHIATMVRKLKHHESKLLRKVDFVNYKSDDNHRQAEIVRRYSISKPADYTSYNRLCGKLRHLAHRIALLPPESPVRRKQEDLLLEKLHDMGLLGVGGGGTGKLSDVERKITVSAFCRRRLGVVMTRLRMVRPKRDCRMLKCVLISRIGGNRQRRQQVHRARTRESAESATTTDMC